MDPTTESTEQEEKSKETDPPSAGSRWNDGIGSGSGIGIREETRDEGRGDAECGWMGWDVVPSVDVMVFW